MKLRKDQNILLKRKLILNNELKFVRKFLLMGIDIYFTLMYNLLNGGENMEKILNAILEEIKDVKKEVQETKTGLREEIHTVEQGLTEKMDTMEVRLREEMNTMEVRLREEMNEMKQDLREEMEEMKQDLREEMDRKNNQQTAEIAEELQNILITIDKKYRKLKEEINGLKNVNNEVLKELRINREEHNIFNEKIRRLEYYNKIFLTQDTQETQEV